MPPTDQNYVVQENVEGTLIKHTERHISLIKTEEAERLMQHITARHFPPPVTQINFLLDGTEELIFFRIMNIQIKGSCCRNHAANHL